jgi:hypothetical protein
MQYDIFNHRDPISGYLNTNTIKQFATRLRFIVDKIDPSIDVFTLLCPKHSGATLGVGAILSYPDKFTLCLTDHWYHRPQLPENKDNFQSIFDTQNDSLINIKSKLENNPNSVILIDDCVHSGSTLNWIVDKIPIKHCVVIKSKFGNSNPLVKLWETNNE